MADKRKNRVFKTERRDIEFPMWRKKVDASIFYDKAILIPKFAESWWGIPKQFKAVHSKKDANSKVQIVYENEIFEGYVTELNAVKRKGSYRLFYNSDLADLLKEKFLMSFMRDLEFKLGDYDNDKNNRISIEEVIPFNEFLDIEYSAKELKFIFTAHFTQEPIMPSLFKKILGTTVLKSIEIELEDKVKGRKRIIKNKWIPRDELSKYPDRVNVIYMLLDKNNSEFYVGEAKSLKSRLGQERKEIPGWTHFRYNVLPPVLESYRLDIERMIIRDFASVLPNNKEGLKSMKISEFKLTNKKIDF